MGVVLSHLPPWSEPVTLSSVSAPPCPPRLLQHQPLLQRPPAAGADLDLPPGLGRGLYPCNSQISCFKWWNCSGPSHIKATFILRIKFKHNGAV